MKKLYLIIFTLICSNITFGIEKGKFENKKSLQVGPRRPFVQYFFLPVTSFLSIWGAYDEGSHTNGDVPLINFDRGMDVNEERQRLISRISILGSWEYKIYQAIFRDAKLDLDNDEPGNNAIIAKNAAFVYWLGVNEEGVPLTNSTPYTRIWFYNRVNEILQGWKGKKLSFRGKMDQVWRAKENMLLMQAEDYLEASRLQGVSPMYYEEDRKKNKEVIAWFTYELYSNANNLLSGLFNKDLGGALHVNNNMNLIVSASIGMGAIVCHDKRETLFEVQKHPKRWASSAHAHINDLMWYNFGLFGKNNSLSKKLLKKGI